MCERVSRLFIHLSAAAKYHSTIPPFPKSYVTIHTVYNTAGWGCGEYDLARHVPAFQQQTIECVLRLHFVIKLEPRTELIRFSNNIYRRDTFTHTHSTTKIAALKTWFILSRGVCLGGWSLCQVNPAWARELSRTFINSAVYNGKCPRSKCVHEPSKVHGGARFVLIYGDTITLWNNIID